MKKIAGIIIGLVVAFSASSQSVDDSISMEALYTNQSFYSLENGEVLNIDNNDWDLGFATYGNGAAGSAIILNEATAALWSYPGDTAEWSTFDTTGYVAWEQLLNTDVSWTDGAFNKYRGASGMFDMGWGVLNPSNNYWTFGDSLYLTKLGDGTFRKLWIVSLKSGIWEFKYANIDGSNEQVITIDKVNYPNRNFAYHSMIDEISIDREPDNSSWDIMFAKHTDEAVPGVFVSVTSVFNNRNVWSAKSNENSFAEASIATTAQTTFNQEINNIGREWKKYSSGTGWVVYDSIAYFAYDYDSTDFYRIVFTGFGGMGTGKAYFNTEKLYTVSLNEMGIDYKFSLYPNPAKESATLLIDYPETDKVTIEIFTLSGERVYTDESQLDPGVNQQLLQLDNLNSGIYLVKVKNERINLTQRLVIQ